VATSLAAEADAVVEASGSRLAQRPSIMLADWRGWDAEAVALIDAAELEVLRRSEGLVGRCKRVGRAQRYKRELARQPTYAAAAFSTNSALP
jgi:hypothetical protein